MSSVKRSLKPDLSGNGRRGVTTVETAVILVVFLTMVLGMIDLGFALFRYHQVSEAARQGVRMAIVHGELGPPEMPQWGPATIDVPATAIGVGLVGNLQPFLRHLDPVNTQITAEWLDGSAALQQRVRVTVSTTYQPFLTSLLGSTPFTLTASSTMQIAH